VHTSFGLVAYRYTPKILPSSYSVFVDHSINNPHLFIIANLTMQSSAENQQVVVAAPAPAEDEKLLAALKQLESLGCAKHNLRLLQKTNGDVDVVREFLIAKKKLHEAKLAFKASKKEGKQCRRKEKFERKRETKVTWKHGQREKEEKIAQKEWKKSICGKFRHGHHKREEEATAQDNDSVDASVDAKLLPILNVWPSQISRLYLDGNNMLYVAAPLRQKAIRRREMGSANLILSSVAYEFSKLLPAVHTTMVFDSVRSTVSQSYGGDNFQILSARPAFATSDDALVHWAKQNAENHVLSMVVTADRGLQKRLSECSGVIIVRPKVWMAFAAFMLDNKGQQPTAGGETPDKINLDQWMSQWIQKMDPQMDEEASLADQLQDSLKVSNAN
jgi:rRNA-processing protein FCF1